MINFLLIVAHDSKNLNDVGGQVVISAQFKVVASVPILVAAFHHRQRFANQVNLDFMSPQIVHPCELHGASCAFEFQSRCPVTLKMPRQTR